MNCKVVDNYTNKLSSEVVLAENNDWKHEYIRFNSGATTEAMFRFSVIWGGAYLDDFVLVKEDSPEGQELLEQYKAEQETIKAANGGAVFVDNMENFGKIHKYNGSWWRVYGDKPEFFNNRKRIARAEGSKNCTASLIYKVENMTNFIANIAYCDDKDIIFYYSSDGEEWFNFDADETIYVTNNENHWTKSLFSASSSFPEETMYLKMEFTDQNPQFWTPQIIEVKIFDADLPDNALDTSGLS